MARCCASRDSGLHARIAEALESQFAEIAESQPELLARHCTEAGLIRKLLAYGQSGQRSLERWRWSKLPGGADLVPSTRSRHCPPRRAASRGDQVSGRAHNPLIIVKGYAAPETKAAVERARLLIEQAEALGEPPEDPLAVVLSPLRLLDRQLCGVRRRLCAYACGAVLALAEKQGATSRWLSGIA